MVGAHRVATVEVAEPLLEDLSNSAVSPPASSQFGQLSYSQQYDHLFSRLPLDVRKPVPKPSPDAQRVRTCTAQAARVRCRTALRSYGQRLHTGLPPPRDASSINCCKAVLAYLHRI